MGVAALVLLLLIQVAALAAVPRISLAAAALVLAAVTARVAVVLATGSPPRAPAASAPWSPARPRRRTGSWRSRCSAVPWPRPASRPAGGRSPHAGLPPAGGPAGRLARPAGDGARLGGMTGDVFGAILEVSTTAVLVTCALAS